MKKISVLVLVFILGLTVGWWLHNSRILNSESFKSPLAAKPTETPTPLYEYSFEKLREKKFTSRKIELVEKMSDGDGGEYQSWLYRFDTNEGWVSGQVNFPSQFSVSNFQFSKIDSKYPIIIMLRGYVEKTEYQTGAGTKNAAAYFAKNGFITLAPDFLGYGTSDPESSDDLKSRFIRPATILQLIASLEDSSPQEDLLLRTNSQQIGIWGHSNGGQIALSVLELTDKVIPTALWAPVSKPFPYSILYYTDDIDDHGKYLIGLMADFENVYDAERFSLTNYFSLIKSPVQVHHGTADESVPKKWSDDLVEVLKKEKIEVNYFIYRGADHNLKPGWDTVVKRDLEFFKKEL